MARKPLSNVDTAWLRMEDPANLMMITGVMVFGAPMDYERLKATLEHGFSRFDRFRSRVVQPVLPGSNFYWEDDPDFDLGYHLQRATLPPPGDQAALQDVASLLASTQLDFSRPLWQFHLVEDYGDGCALICRLHHSIGDGIALVHVLLSLTSDDPDDPWPVTEPRAPRRRDGRPLGHLLRPARLALRTTRQVTGTLVREGMAAVNNPSRIAELAKTGVRGTASLGRLLLLWPDPKTVFKGPLGVPKRAAWSAPIPLEDVKTVGQGLRGTVNDVLLTAMAGGLRRYLEGRREPVEGLNFRAVVPVDLRPSGVEPDLGNKFGLVFLSLPVGIADPGERLRELKKRMDALKGSLEAPVAFGILNAIGMAPEQIQDIVVNIFGMKGTAVMTNVIGPREQLYMAGAPLESLMFWVPQSGRLGMGVSILSYAGQVFMGVITDEGLVHDPDTIIADFGTEFDDLLTLVKAADGAPGVKQAVEELEETLATLDAVLEDSAGSETETRGPAVARCQALTRMGRQCKNRPLPASSYCRVHQKQQQ
jgi:WS/DGAT/MGAT family acyltransferase